MTSRFLLFISIVIFSLGIATSGHGHHHVIIHVPYKIHTIHHTVTKHIHHHDSGDKYELIGYTVGKPVNIGHHFGTSHEQSMSYHNFGGNELGIGNRWIPSYEQNELTTDNNNQKKTHIENVPVHEFTEQGVGVANDDNYGSYD